MMHCEDAETHLNDYVDGLLRAETQAALEEHLHACGDCQAEERLLRQIIEQTRGLPESIEPERDLWPGIEALIQGQIVEFPPKPSRSYWAPLTLLSAIAAAAVILLTVGLNPRVVEEIPPAQVAPGPQAQPVGLSQVEQDYRRSKEALLAALRSKEDLLTPETITKFEESLLVLENAVTDIRQALLDDPDNPHLENMLLATYTTEVDLLQQAMRLLSKS